MLNESDIDHLAQLSRLTLSNEEKTAFVTQLPEILNFVDQVQEIAKLEEGKAEIKIVRVDQLRADEESGTRLTVAELEKLAPAWRDGQLEVPAVFGTTDEG